MDKPIASQEQLTKLTDYGKRLVRQDDIDKDSITDRMDAVSKT